MAGAVVWVTGTVAFELSPLPHEVAGADFTALTTDARAEIDELGYRGCPM